MNTVEMQMPDYAGADFETFARATDQPGINAVFKRMPEDFVVDEHLPFELSGSGEHAWLHIRKRGSNTDWVAKQLARHAGVRARNVGYAGLKDRHGLTSQWFSVHLPGKPDPDWSQLESDEICILDVRRHDRKLRRGALKQNRFEIRLREVRPDNVFDHLVQRCERIATEGVPNYFGEQRFGHNMENLLSAEAMFRDDESRVPRHLKSLYLSAARSWVFNQVLSQRVEQGSWNRRIPGDVFMLEGKTACFQDDASDDLDQRLAGGDIHPTAVLWGEGEQLSKADAAALEKTVIDSNPVFRDGLLKFRLEARRRALRVIPADMQWRAEAEDFLISFRLPAGSYATMVLRELLDCDENPAPR